MLYVAKFHDNGHGEWLPLVFGHPGLDRSNGFEDQGALLVKTCLAADAVGATKMDCPEWITVDPHAAGSTYCTLTNNSKRGKEGKAPPDAANPRADNILAIFFTGRKKITIPNHLVLTGIFWCWVAAPIHTINMPKVQ